MLAFLLAVAVVFGASPWRGSGLGRGRLLVPAPLHRAAREVDAVRNPRGGVPLAGTVTTNLGGAAHGMPWRLRRARRPGIDVDVTVLLELLRVATGAGAPVPRALEVVGSAVGGADGAALREVGAALVLGATWAGAWDIPVRRARLDPVAYALKQAWEGGAAPGPLLAAAAAHLRRHTRSRSRTAAGHLGVRLVLPLGLCLLPAFVLIGMVPVFVSLGAGLLGP